MSQRTQPVTIRGAGDEQPPSPGQVRIEEWTKPERTRRALKLGAACWGLALFSVILPLVHFVLVPLLLLAGPIVVIHILGVESVILEGEGACPHCRAPFTIARRSLAFPFHDHCTACGRGVTVEAETLALP
jgi:hypothetical protein